MLPKDVAEFMALDYLEHVQPTIIYLASPYASDSATVRHARLEAVRQVCGNLVNQGKIVLSPMVYTGELAQRGYHPPQGWYAFDLQFLSRADELLVLQLPGWEQRQRHTSGNRRRPSPQHPHTPNAPGGRRATRLDP